ncbi:uncharacterized protein RCC_11016 [Ramularia collo-cygni]|uniref:Uncharacterized protein n=1 Tax=Ramularia collo-cygni TaxID=112498 RepID=A0A2D3VS19_9PEZI|nr:uncharacterized protein RCC_11016 [Ramularia collo-cygni]CZT25288.1 uncharacterized protein RCC_11016 [Ramularia collo-cygni]
MQPFTVLSQSWYTNSQEPAEAVPQWVLDGARIADDSPRSSIDSFESSGIQIYLEESPAPPSRGPRSIPIVCKAILASWRQANRPPRWNYEASPRLS